MLEEINSLFQRDIKRLETEINAFEDEAQLWELHGSISNTAGNLVLHLCGNLQHFIGATLGNTGYVRDREGEFAKTNVPRAELLADLTRTSTAIENTLKQLDPNLLDKTYPLAVLGRGDMTVSYFLIHLQGHFNYHLGQINYLRRITS